MEKTTVEVGLHYGALAEPLEEQLNRQGFTLGENREFIDELWNGLCMCKLHLLTNTQYDSCLKKFHKQVMNSIKPLNDNENEEEIFRRAMEEARKVIGVDPAYFGEEGREEVERQLNKLGYRLGEIKGIIRIQ